MGQDLARNQLIEYCPDDFHPTTAAATDRDIDRKLGVDLSKSALGFYGLDLFRILVISSMLALPAIV